LAEPPRVLIVGGSGVFGRLLARELLETTGAHLVIAGRDPWRAVDACLALDAPGRVEPLGLDLTREGALANAARDCAIVACAAGPFQCLPPQRVAEALAAGAHWLDISDSATWVLGLLDDAVLARGALRAARAVLTGQSSVPALSGALVRWCLERAPGADRARVTLSIGNRNAKGRGAIASALGSTAPRPRWVALPFGRRRALPFASPDAALLRRELGLAAEMQVAFQLPGASAVLACAALAARRLSAPNRLRLAAVLATLAAPLSRLGSGLGCLQADLFQGGRLRARAAFVSTDQRLAILPAARAARELLDADHGLAGVPPPSAWLPPERWIAHVQARGARFLGQVLD